MTPEERTLLTQFLGDLSQTQGVAKDRDAAALIDDSIRRNPDSAYVLVQHAILADQALVQAQAQIADLKAQLQRAQQPQQPPSFLGGAGLGPSVAQPQTAWGQAAQQPQPQSQPFFGGAGGLFSGGGGLGSFLRSAGTTAAGVAGGEMLFSGLSGLFGGHRGGGFGGFGGGAWDQPVENVTINEYGDGGGYDDDGGYDDNNY
jgi:hypothetical protein